MRKYWEKRSRCRERESGSAADGIEHENNRRDQ